MKLAAPLIICVLLAALVSAGCTGTQKAATPTPTTVAVTTITTSPTPTPTISFTMGDHYLQKSYSFQSESDVRTEQLRIDDPSWGIEFTVLPLNDDPQYCWFTMTVANINTGRNETFGYGRTFSFDKYQQYPMYSTGPYVITLKGNRVKVDLNIAKRNP